jgi:hypothetical protein
MITCSVSRLPDLPFIRARHGGRFGLTSPPFAEDGAAGLHARHPARDSSAMAAPPAGKCNHWHVREYSWIGGQKLISKTDPPGTSNGICSRYVPGANSEFQTSDAKATIFKDSQGLDMGGYQLHRLRAERATIPAPRSHTASTMPRT